jgi:thymidylate synthase (FAD)
MKIIKPNYEILTTINGDEILKTIEKIARTCYKSEDKIDNESSKKLITRLINSGHEAMIEFFDITVKFICDRGVSHEIVRHRLASYAEESTRYCNYSKDKFGNQITYIQPNFWSNCPESDDDCEKYAILKQVLIDIEKAYNKLIDLGASPQEARYILPNGLKTEINVKMNLREWRHFLKLRCSKAAHPQMRELAIPLLEEIKDLLPIIFDDIKY